MAASTLRRRRLVAGLAVGALIAVIATAAASVSGGPAAHRHPAPVGRATTSTSAPPHPASSPTAALALLGPPVGPGYLQPGSDPAVLPGPLLIADKANSRLLIVDPQGRIRWQFPRPGDLPVGQTFSIPDDAFFTPDGREVVATAEDDSVIWVIDIATHRIVYHFGHPGIAGVSAGYLHNPDDAMMLPDGYLIMADIKNCRVILVAPGGSAPARQYGTDGSCMHAPPARFGSPNGAFPLRDGNYLITEINGDWVDEMSLTGQVLWSIHPPAVAYPSDTNEVSPGRYLTVDYSTPGQVVEFDRSGRSLFRYAPTSPGPALDHPSLALPLPNGDILLNDDYNDRVIVIDPKTDRIVWQYGHDNVHGTGPGFLHIPDGIDLFPPYSLAGTHASTMGQP